MKGLSIKKLAAIAVGGALIGSALAPVVSAAVTSNIDQLQKSDVVNTATGEPVVNVVAGSVGAAQSDLIWAGNIAAKVAQLATVDTAVSITGGEEDSTADPTGLSVDVTVGGDVTYSTESSQTYQGNQYPLQSNPNAAASSSKNDPLVKELTNAQLSFLTNETRTYRYNGSSYSIVVKEKIGINADARMDMLDKDVEDLVVYMSGEGDFNYVLDLGDGIPADHTTSSGSATKFTDGDNDNIIIPFLGETFTVQEVNYVSGSTFTLKLIKESDKATYYEGQEIVGLDGRGNYDGEEMSVVVDAITQAGAATTTYNVRYLLLDSEGNEIDRQTLASGEYLNEVFVDSEGEYALETVVYISDAGIESTTSKGFITATVGKSVADVATGKVYPYDSTDTDSTDDYWKATLSFSTDGSPDVNTLQKITVKNAVKKWNVTNPLYASDSSLTQDDPSGEAVFLEGNSEDDLGYNFVRLKFHGFKLDQDTTVFKVGRGACETSEGQDAGCIIHTDNAGVEREVPFYYELLLTTGPSDEASFMLDDQTFYYRCDMTDTNMPFANEEALNGIPLGINYDATDGSLRIVVDYNVTKGGIDVNGGMTGDDDLAGCQAFGPTGCSADINALWADMNLAWDTGSASEVALGFDGNCQFSKQSFSNFASTDILKAAGNTPMYDTMFYDDDNTTIDKIFGFSTIEVTNDSLNDTYKYKMYVTDEASYKKVYLLLDNTTDFTSEFTNTDLYFMGTDAGAVIIGVAVSAIDNTPYWMHEAGVTEDGSQHSGTAGAVSGLDANFYVPDLVALGLDPGDNDYITASVGIDLNETGEDANVYIDTSNGELISFPNAQRTGYDSQVDFNQKASWSLRSDSPSLYTDATWLDYGSKAELVTTSAMGDYAKFTMPENQLYLKFAVLGEATVTTAEGGTSFTELAEGESGEEGSTKVTVDAINYTAGVCPAGGGAVADPSTYSDITPVGQLVYLDTPEPAGANIVVGGWIVNKLVTSSTALGAGEGTLGEALTTSGDRVVQLLDNGDIVVAGYTANDTKLAAQDLIDALDALIV